jgi:hypothetical protein
MRRKGSLRSLARATNWGMRSRVPISCRGGGTGGGCGHGCQSPAEGAVLLGGAGCRAWFAQRTLPNPPKPPSNAQKPPGDRPPVTHRQHLEHRLVGAAVRRPPQRRDAAGDAGKGVGLAAAGGAHLGRGGLEGFGLSTFTSVEVVDYLNKQRSCLEGGCNCIPQGESGFLFAHTPHPSAKWVALPHCLLNGWQTRAMDAIEQAAPHTCREPFRQLKCAPPHKNQPISSVVTRSHPTLALLPNNPPL